MKRMFGLSACLILAAFGTSRLRGAATSSQGKAEILVGAGDIAICDGIVDCSIDEVRKECNAVFEIIVDNLHDARGELEDANMRRLLHLRCSVEEAIGRDAGV